MIDHRVGSFAAITFISALTACGGRSAEPASAEATSQWAGHQYYLTVPLYSWATPRGVGRDLFPIEPAFFIKVGEGAHPLVTIGTGPATRVRADSSYELIPVEEAQQDPCGPTATFELDGSRNEIALDSMRVFLVNRAMTSPVQVTSTFYGVRLEGVLPNGDRPSTAGTFEAALDLSELYVLFNGTKDSTDPDSICHSLSAIYTPTGCQDAGCALDCGTCPDTGVANCPPVTADTLGAVEAPNLEIVEVDEGNRPASCADGLAQDGG